MNWLTRLRGGISEITSRGDVSFVGEQDGEPERQFKHEASELLVQFPHIRRAYLARASWSKPPGTHVTLCLSSSSGTETKAIRALASLFKGHFTPSQHIDILFLSEAQEQALARVCSPFFGAR